VQKIYYLIFVQIYITKNGFCKAVSLNLNLDFHLARRCKSKHESGSSSFRWIRSIDPLIRWIRSNRKELIRGDYDRQPSTRRQQPSIIGMTLFFGLEKLERILPFSFYDKMILK